MTLFSMYALCMLITTCYVLIHIEERLENPSEHETIDKLLVALIYGLLWPMLLLVVVVGFLSGFLKALIGGSK